MKHLSAIRFIVITSLVFAFSNPRLIAQTDAFTYQGSLADSGALADGSYDMRFTLHTIPVGGGAIATVEKLGVEVTNGLFSVELDFGTTQFNAGSDRHMEISVRFDGEPTYSILAPRTQLHSVPFAAHADVAYFANTGPFEPRDTTPSSYSGVLNQTISVMLDLDGELFTDATIEPVFPISISREIIPTPNLLVPGSHHDFIIEFTTPYDQANQWRDHFDQTTSNVDVTLTTTAPILNQCRFVFTGGIVSGYRLEQDRQILEVITITFSQNPQNNIPLANYASRDTDGYNPFGNGPFSPYLGGGAVLPDTYFFSYDGRIPTNSSVGTLPGEDRSIFNGTPTSFIDERPVALLHNVFEDRFSILWEEFASGSGSNKPLELRDVSGVLWTAPTQAMISSWTLDIADDGGLFEIYEFQYLADPIFP